MVPDRNKTQHLRPALLIDFDSGFESAALQQF
jgi:hypothetical protein